MAASNRLVDSMNDLMPAMDVSLLTVADNEQSKAAMRDANSGRIFYTTIKKYIHC